MKTILSFSVIVVIVLISFLYPRTMLNPGQLTAKHQELKDNCISCHEPFWGIKNDKCISCHKLSEIGKNKSENTDIAGNGNNTMFHSKLEDVECSSCHTDHEGINSKITNSNFDHDILSKNIKEKCSDCHVKPADDLHSQLSVNCYSCHNTAEWKLTGKFDHSMITGTKKDECNTCHKSPEDEFHLSLKDNCSKCHNTGKWIPADFDHSLYFILDKDHNASCKTCHTENAFSKYTCYGCHEHNEADIFQKHSEENINNISDCVSCHKSGNEHDIKGKNDNERKNGSDNESGIKNKNDDENKNRNKKEHEKNDDDDD